MTSYGYERLPPAETNHPNEESESLLPSTRQDAPYSPPEKSSKLALLNWCPTSERRVAKDGSMNMNKVIGLALGAGFASGVLSLLFLQHLFPTSTVYGPRRHSPIGWHPSSYGPIDKADFSFPHDIGATEHHQWPPANPTNKLPDMFPTEVGYAGPTVTGAEPGLVATAANYPMWKGVDGLVQPKLYDAKNDGNEGTPEWIEDDGRQTSGGKHRKKFDIFQHWGNLSPFYSVPPNAFGLEGTSGVVPEGCELKGVHILHRHGARYPTGRFEYAAPNKLAYRLSQAANNTRIHAEGPLSFLNTWTYKLGTEVLTPFGRQQLFDLGVSMRMKYGSLLEGFTDRLPVFRTESQDRMLASATNFALGFFGWPLDDKFLMSVTIEADLFNNTLAPYKTCPNDWREDIGNRGTYYVKQWVHVYLREAKKRLNRLTEGFEWSFEDTYTAQMLCAYETVALGYSAFCGLFTEEEWEGFEYALDLYFWYDSGFGAPVARALGSGYVLELLSRLTQTPLHSNPSPFTPSSNPFTPLISNPSTFSVNLTMASNPTTFPLGNDLYVDATHEVVIVNILTALNLTSLMAGAEGGLDGKKMKRGRRWETSRIAPFASNMQLQLLICPSSTTSSADSTPTQVRIILNDAPVALSGIANCPSDGLGKEGMCPLDTFITSQKKLLEKTDWDWTCHGNWTVPEGDEWKTFTGDPPAKPN